MLELAERCEAATVPDRELGFKILLACGWRRTNVGHFHGPLYYWSDGGGKRSYSEDRLPCPTALLDAAMTLVPEGMDWRVDTMTGLPGAIVCAPNAWLSTKTAPMLQHGATPALALCAAALRARAALET
jgi:hypothetical protein